MKIQGLQNNQTDWCFCTASGHTACWIIWLYDLWILCEAVFGIYFVIWLQ